MRRNTLLTYSLLGTATVLIGVAVASAQSQPGADPNGGTGGTSLGAVTLDADNPRTIAQQLSLAEQYVSHMGVMRDGMEHSRRDAIEANDPVKYICLDDKLYQMYVALRSGTDRKAQLELAASRDDKEITDHEFLILSFVYQRAQQLDVEAKQCIGKDKAFVGESSTTSEVDPNLPQEDSTEYPDPGVVLQPPLSGSNIK